MKKLKKLMMLMTMGVMSIGLTACVDVVETGSTGVKKRLGEIQKEAYAPGMYFYNPFTESFFSVDNKEKRKERSTTVYTKDVQQATIQYAINYYLEPGSTIDVVSTVGRDYEPKLIPQVINGNIKNIIGKWDAIELIANREKATSQIREAIAKDLSRKGISITVFQLTNVAYQPEFEKAVEDKVIAVQKAQAEENRTVQVEEQSKQKIITAKAEAEAMTIKTKALEKSQSLVLYEAVQKWDGTLPKIMSGDGGTLLNVPQDFAK